MSRVFSGGLLVLAFAVGASGATPDYLAKALRDFPRRNLPADLGYETEVVRNGHRTRERHDPTRPAGEQWVLLEFAGRVPTAAEINRHRVVRARGGNSAAFQTDFGPPQIDRGSLRLEHESVDTAVFTGGFTEEAASADALLGRMSLRLTVDKRRGEITAYELRLPRPYSPVLGVKISELAAGAEFHRPAGLDLALPRRTWSHFKGRIFLSSTLEDLEVRYSAYRRMPAETPPRTAGGGERGH
jgi:hypothetical protein